MEGEWRVGIGEITNFHICAPAQTAKKKHMVFCPDCERYAWFYSFFTPWYGWHTTCTKCGRQFVEGEWLDLPFKRGAREESIAWAKKKWKEMPPVSENHYH
jgi:uncharacterized protein YbdZ (MbtH family)